jgi:predicted RNase H-like nuclease
MRKFSNDVWLAGVDGCSEGWLAVLVRPAGNDVHVRPVFGNFAELFTGPKIPALVVVDMPIGLPKFSELRGRAPERIVRPLLGSRKSSVFRIPSRRAVCASVDPTFPDDKERYVKACEIARETSPDQKAFSKQGFYICRKIVELDQLLRARPDLIECVFETHPEVAFWKLKGTRPLSHPKRRNSRPYKPGMAERRCLLEAEFPVDVLYGEPPKGAAEDDLLDALVCAAVARRKYCDKAESFPDTPEKDEHGLAMAIWA